MKTWLDAAEECGKIASELVADPEHRVHADFMAAKIAMLRGDPTAAIEILDNLVARATDETAPLMNVSAKVVGSMWKGTVARYHGDFHAARAAYARASSEDPGDLRVKGIIRIMCHLYLAEIEAACSRKKEMVEQLRLAKAVPPPEGENAKGMHSFYCDWAEYLLKVSNTSATEAQKSLTGSHQRLEACWLATMVHLMTIGIGVTEALFEDAGSSLPASMNLALRNRASAIDRSIALFASGYFAAEDREDLRQAEAYFARVFGSDSFLAPEGGIWLLIAQVRQGNDQGADATVGAIEKRFPGYKDWAHQSRKREQEMRARRKQ